MRATGRSKMLAAGVGIFCAIALSARPLRAADDDAGQRFQQQHGDELRNVRGTFTPDDDLALAREMLAKAGKCPAGQAELIALLCQTAYDLSCRTPEGREIARAAMQRMAEACPHRRATAWANLSTLWMDKSRAGTTMQRLIAAEVAIEYRGMQARAEADTGDFQAASVASSQALKLAVKIRSPLAGRLKGWQLVHAEAVRTEKLRAKLRRALQNDPNDHAARNQLTRIALAHGNDPNAARSMLTPASLDTFRTYLPLLDDEPNSLPPASQKELADWLVTCTEDASLLGELNLLKRARRRYAALFEQDLGPAAKNEIQSALLAVDERLARADRLGELLDVREIPIVTRAFARVRSHGSDREKVKLTLNRMKAVNRVVDVHADVKYDEDGRLVGMRLEDNIGLTTLDPLFGLEMQWLELVNNPNVRGDLAALSQAGLRRLVISGCHSIESLSGVERLPLENITIANCNELRGGVWPLRLSPVKVLRLGDLRRLTGLDGLSWLAPERLSIERCGVAKGSLTAIDPNSLTHLWVTACPKFSLEGIASQQSLQGLWLADRKEADSLARLKGLKLRVVHLTDVKGVTDIAVLEKMPVVNLRLVRCPDLSDADAIGKLPLKHLNVQDCSKAAIKPELLKGKELVSLALAGCASIKDLRFLEGMPLEKLWLIRLGGLKGDLTALRGLKLRELHIQGCRGLTSLKGVEALRLKRFSCIGCIQIAKEEWTRLLKVRSLEEVYTGNRQLDRRILHEIRH